MRDRLLSMIDRPVTIRTLPEKPSWQPVRGTVFSVGESTVDVLIDHGVMKTVAIAMVIDVSLDHGEARRTVLEDPPDHADYALGKRRLFEAEELLCVQQPREAIEAKARSAADHLRAVRAAFPKHAGVARRLQRAHFLATGFHDYERYPEVTGGDVDDTDYQDAKQRFAKLEKALRARRPEREVAILLRSLAREAGRALARYPNHQDLLAWFERAETLRQKLSRAIQIDNDMAQPFEPARSAADPDGTSGIVRSTPL